MRTTVVLDDELMAKAEEYTGIREKSALIRAALRALVEREAAAGWPAWPVASPMLLIFYGDAGSAGDPRRHVDLGGSSASRR